MAAIAKLVGRFGRFVSRVVGITEYRLWVVVVLAIVLIAGIFVALAQTLWGSEPNINLLGYVGGLLIANCVIFNALKRGAKLPDWLLLVGSGALVVFGWFGGFTSEAKLDYSFLVIVVAVGILLGIAGAIKVSGCMDWASNAVDKWLGRRPTQEKRRRSN